MLKYTIKRILLMIPTFISISFLIFLLLNFAPGNPGTQAGGADGNQNAQTSGEQRESYRIFKEQFNLDKPVLFNTLYNLNQQDIETCLETILNIDKKYKVADRIQSQDDIENWGSYAVPGLIQVLQKSTNPQVRSLASQRLKINAKKRLHVQYGGKLSKAKKQENKQITKDNLSISTWFFLVDKEGKPKANGKSEKEVQDFWATWWEKNQQSWDYSQPEIASIFFFDTRFAKYWGNLIRLDFGISHQDKRPVIQTVMSKLKYSVTLAISSLFIIYLISLPLGIWSAVNQNSRKDRLVTVVLFMLYSLPSFFTGVIILNLVTIGTEANLQLYMKSPWSEYALLPNTQVSGDWFQLMLLVLSGIGFFLTLVHIIWAQESHTNQTVGRRRAMYFGAATLLSIILLSYLQADFRSFLDGFWLALRNCAFMASTALLGMMLIKITFAMTKTLQKPTASALGFLGGVVFGYALSELLLAYGVPNTIYGLNYPIPLVALLGIIITRNLPLSKPWTEPPTAKSGSYLLSAVGYGSVSAACVVLLLLFDNELPVKIFPNKGFNSLYANQLTTLDLMKDIGWHIVLPVFCMCYGSLAALSRYARTGLLDIIRADFIRTARAKGLPESVVIIKHAARNGMIPILTLMATMLPALIGGSVIIETIFGIPGMGSYIFESILLRDYNAVMAVLLISSTLTLIGMLISDLSYALVDPRITFD